MDSEVERRIVHASGAVVPTVYLLGQLEGVPDVPWSWVQAFLLVGTVSALCLEAVRLFVGLDWVIFDKLTREYEQDNLAGYALYAIGGTFAGLLFEPTVAIPAMYMLSIGDPISGLLSSGELRDVKRPRVLVAMFTVSFVFAILFLPLLAAIAAALAATLADGVKPVVATYVIDDNLTIPIAASITGWVGLQYLPEVVLATV
ncbi:dolichol kinase [Haloarchaeobius sp. TZWWS8]|uniref:dolichol kinase n=1 Tax=Haloarchaeobius sp. TZWWS8 TaxID=3446121 RepID=UPI003EBAFED8